MTRTRSLVRSALIAALAATVALLISGLAQPRSAEALRPDRLAMCERNLGFYKDELARAQNELAYYQSAYQELMKGLDQVDRINSRQGRNVQARIRKAIENTRSRTAAYVQPPSAPYPQPSDPYTQPQPTPPYVDPYQPAPIQQPGGIHLTVQPIDNGNFNLLLNAVKQASFEQDRVAIVAEAARQHYFVVAQVVTLMQVMSFEDSRIDVAARLYPRVLDSERWFQVYEALTFSSSRQTLDKRIRALSPGR